MASAEASEPSIEQDVPATRAAKKKRAPYLTEKIIRRRSGILEAARQLMSESVGNDFTVRDLASRAGVSTTTIYATYGDKESLVAAAIEDFYRHLPLAPAARSLEGVLTGIDEAWQIIRKHKALVRNMTALYFSQTLDERIYRVIRDIGIASILPWLEQAEREGDTLPGLTREFMCTELADARWVALAAWCSGRVHDKDLSLTVKAGFLVAARGITTGKMQQRVSEALIKCARVPTGRSREAAGPEARRRVEAD